MAEPPHAHCLSKSRAWAGVASVVSWTVSTDYFSFCGTSDSDVPSPSPEDLCAFLSHDTGSMVLPAGLGHFPNAVELETETQTDRGMLCQGPMWTLGSSQ